MADFTKILSENQKQMLELITPAVRKTNVIQNLDNSDSEAENLLPNTTSIKTKATTSKNTPVNSRNRWILDKQFHSKVSIRWNLHVVIFLVFLALIQLRTWI